MYKDGKVVGFGALCVNLYNLIYLIIASIILLILMFCLLLLLRIQELMIIPQCYGISVWDIFLGT